jgi:hypothetical protein
MSIIYSAHVPASSQFFTVPVTITVPAIRVKITPDNYAGEAWWAVAYMSLCVLTDTADWVPIYNYELQPRDVILTSPFKEYRLRINPVRQVVGYNLELSTYDVVANMGIQYPQVNGKPTTNQRVTATTVSATSVQILAAADDRVGGILINNSSKNLYIKLGTAAATVDIGSCILVPAGGNFDLPDNHQGAIQGIWTAIDGTSQCRVFEFI